TAAPVKIPPNTPNTEKIDSTQPAALRLKPRSARNSGTATITLPTCSAAIMPAATTMATASQWVVKAGSSFMVTDEDESLKALFIVSTLLIMASKICEFYATPRRVIHRGVYG